MKTINTALITPFSTGPTRGNMITAGRIAGHLPQVGCRVTALSLDSMNQSERSALLKRSDPDLLHALHAYHAGPTARTAARDLGIPYIITITGSDLFDTDYCSDISARLAIQDAAQLTCFDELVAGKLIEAFPAAARKTSIVPQGVAPLPLSKTLPHAGGDFIVFLPAAIRPVKGISNALDALELLAGEFPELRLILAGGALDQVYAEEIRKRVATLSWVRMLGDVPHQQMGDLLAASDLVLNCSVFEGGMANTLLEAMSMGKPVLARDILGNRSLVHHGKTGWLFGSDKELQEIVRMLLVNPLCRFKTGEAGRNFVQKHFSVLSEAERYRKVYELVLGR